jgi:hypothetical protein
MVLPLEETPMIGNVRQRDEPPWPRLIAPEARFSESLKSELVQRARNASLRCVRMQRRT